MTPLSYQWWFQGTNPLAGATNAMLALSNVQPAQAGEYLVVVSNTARLRHQRAARYVDRAPGLAH